MGLTYKQAGVDIDAGNRAVSLIKKHVQGTFGREVLADIGLFGGLYDLSRSRVKDPVLVASTDGVGTKLKIAIAMGRHDTIGQDLVNHCVNDILVQGARPLFFLDYIAMGRLKPALVGSLVRGLAYACRRNGCALIGGETAEMSGLYQPGDYDIAGFIVGVAPKKKIINGRSIRQGDVLVGLPSTGLHTNGYTLARALFFQKMRLRPSSYIKELGCSIGDALLRVHRSYGPTILPLLDRFTINGMAHITGGGFLDNIPRILPRGCRAVIHKGTWPVLPIFDLIREKGELTEREAYRTLNMGIGLVLVVPSKEADRIVRAISAKEKCYVLGEIVRGPRDVLLF